MNTSYKIIIIFSSAVLAALILYFGIIGGKPKSVPLQVERPTRGYIAKTVTATGRIEPVDTVSVGTQVSGIIRYLHADYNSQVKKGQLIAELDKSLLQATLDVYKGNLASAESQLSYQTTNLNRQRALFNTGAGSKADYDDALNSYKMAEAAVLSAKAQVRSAQKNLSYANIYSPVDGVVLNRNINTGQTVAANFNTPTLFVIAKDITKMEVYANVDEADIGDVRSGERATFTVDAFMNDQFHGTVKTIRLHPSVSSNVVTYTTIINAANNDMKLKPGMTANVTIYTRERAGAMLIPAQAISFIPDSTINSAYQVTYFRSNKGTNTAEKRVSDKDAADRGSAGQSAMVWLLRGKNELVQKPIAIGLNDNIHVEVLAGLNDSDRVVTGQIFSAGPSRAAGTSPSPFIPRRPGGGRNR